MGDGKGFHTPSTLSTGATIHRVIVAPVDVMPFIGGALSELLNPLNWLEVGESIDDTIQFFEGIMETFYSPFNIGMVAHFPDSVPAGWLALDGSSVLASDYPELAVVVPAGWLVGDDIVLPDLPLYEGMNAAIFAGREP